MAIRSLIRSPIKSSIRSVLEGGISAVDGTWLLVTGYWDNTGVWDNTAFWINEV